MIESSKLFKALSDPNRLRIIGMLQNKSLCVCEITHILDLATSTVSKHLSILKSVDLIIDHKEGKWINYSLNHSIRDPLVISLLEELKPRFKTEKTFKADLIQIETIDRNILCNI